VYSSISKRTSAGLVLSTLAGFVPPLLFEKYTFYLYLIASPNFFEFSGDRLWFNIIWFGFAGVISAFLVGRRTLAAIFAPILSAMIFIIAVNFQPFCEVRECYVSSTDRLAALRDCLLFASLGIITSAASLKEWAFVGYKRVNIVFQFLIPVLVGYALSFFSILHIFAGATVAFPSNYLQWFLAGAPAGLAASMLFLNRGTIRSALAILAAGTFGVVMGLALAVEVPCEACSGYLLPMASILALTVVFSLPAILLRNKTGRRRLNRIPTVVSTATIVITMILLWGFFLTSNYEVSVVNSFVGVNQRTYSPVEVGHSFSYSAGYLAIPRVVSQAVGVNVSFGNSSIHQASYPNDFLAAGVGVQSPNCCKDGLDLSYRTDVIEFSNGTEAVLARAWWACDVNMACGGYSWQQLLHWLTCVT
jgi:hypothetical protein